MKKSYLATAFIVFIAVLMTAIFIMMGDNNPFNRNPLQGETTTVPPASLVDTEAYLDAASESGRLSYPLLATDIDDVLYSMSETGEVVFFRITNGSLEEVEDIQTLDVSVEISNQDVPATVYYIQEDDVLTGFGLYTSEASNSDVFLYDYAFFKITNLPIINGLTSKYRSSSTCLLLVDTNKNDLYYSNKLFEEAFAYDMNDGRSIRYLSDANRSIDDRGAKRADYAMLTDEVIDDKTGNEILFFSSRHYHLFETSNTVDIFRSGGSGNNKDNNRIVKEALGFYAKNTDDGFLYLEKTDTGFATIKHTSSEQEELYSYTGDFADHIRSKDYLLSKNTNTVYHIPTNQTVNINISGGDNFKAEIFSVSQNGKYALMRGISQQVPALVLCDLDKGTGKLYFNESFALLVAPYITSDGFFFCCVQDTKTSADNTYYIFKLD